MKLLFFGIGIATEYLEERLKPGSDIIGYTDSRSDITVYKGKKFYQLEKIKELVFDYVIITSDNCKIALNITDMLEKHYQIPEEKILPYFVYANHELYSIVLNSDNGNEYEGIVFGNSHARDGILTRYLCVKSVNFSISSQDIYGNYRTFQKVVGEYGYKFSNLKYVLIDLYDYNYLNYDTSLSSEMFNYICSNGIIEEHNFRYNENFNLYGGNSFEQQLLERIGISNNSTKCKVLESIFAVNEGVIAKSNTEIYRNRSCIGKNVPLIEEKILGSLVCKRFERTIKENKRLLSEFIKDIKTFYPRAQVIFTLIPRYITMEQVNEVFMAEWKKELYEFVTELKEKYHTLFFDMKTNRSISGNPFFYQDICHLNTVGGISLTSILNEYIRNIGTDVGI